MVHGLLTPSQLTYEQISSTLPLKRQTVDDLMEDAELIPTLLEMVGLETARLYLGFNKLKERLEAAKYEDKATKGRVWLQVSQKEIDGKKPRLDDIQAMVDSHEDVRQAQQAYLQILAELHEAESQYDCWHSLKEALKIKKDTAEMCGRFIQSGILSYSTR